MALTRTRRLLRFLVRTLVAAAVLVVAAYLLRGPLFGGLLRDRIAEELSAALGTRVTIGRVEGSWLSDLALVDVDTPELPADGPLRRARADRVTARYRLRDVLDDPLAGLDDIDVAGVELALRLDAGTDEDSTPPEEDALAAVLRAVPPALPRIHVAGDVELTAPELQARAGFDVTVPRAGQAEIGLSRLALDVAGAALRQDELRLALAHDARSVRLERAFRLSGVQVATFRADVQDTGSRITATLGVGGGTADVTLDATAARATLRGIDAAALRATVEELSPGALPELPAASVDADVELAFGPPAALVARNVAATLGQTRLTIAEARLGDVADPDSVAWTGLALQVGDPAALAAELGLDLTTGPVARLGLHGAELHSGNGTRSDAELRLSLQADAGDVGASGTVTFPAELDDWRAIGIDAEVEADVRAAPAAAAAPDAWALPELVGDIRVDGRFDGTLGAPGGSAHVRTSGLAIGERLVEELDLDAALEKGALTVTQLAAKTDFARLEASGGIDLENGTLSDAAFELDVPDLETIATLFAALPPLEGSLSASGLLSGSLRPDPQLPEDGFPDGVRVEARADAADLVLDGAHLGTVTGALSLEGPVLRVERVRVDGALGRLETSGTAHLVDRSVSVPGFAFSTPDLSALSRWLPALESVQGAVDADGTFSREAGEPWRDARIGLTARAPRLAVPGAELTAVTLQLDADDGRVLLHHADVTTPWGSVHAEGEVRANGETVTATLPRLDLDVDRAVLGLTGAPVELRLRAPVDLLWEADRLEVRGLDADVLGGRLRADLARGRDATLTAVIEGLDLALLTEDATGRLDATLELVGAPERPQGTLTATVPELTWQGTSGRVDVDVTQDAEGLHVARCEIAAGDLAQISAQGYAPVYVGEQGFGRVPQGRARMHLAAHSETPGRWLARFAPEGFRARRATLAVDAEEAALNAELVVDDLGWTAADGVARAGLEGETRVRLTASPSGSSAEISGGGDGPLHVRGSLAIAGPVDWRDPWASAERIPDAALSGSVRVATPDIREVATWFEELRRVEGSAFVDVTLSGTVGHPEWRGSLEGDDLAVVAVDDIPPIDRGRLRATLSGRTATIDSLEVRLGYAPLAATGTVTLSDDDELVFDLHAAGEDVQLVRTQYTRVRAHVDARVTGPLDHLLVSGKVRVTDAWYTQPIGAAGPSSSSSDTGVQLFGIADEPLASMRFDVRVTAEDSVRLDNNVVSGRVSLDMRLRGTGAVPEPQGRAWCHNVTVRLPVTRLTVESAVVTFPADNPFDPELRVSAFARLKGYDLDVQVSGGVSDMDVRIASSPPLTQEDALVLLATGAPPSSEAGGGQFGATAAAGGAAALGDAALDWLSGPGRAGDERITDRVEIYIGREVSESGSSTVEAEIEIVPGWYARFERDRWEDYAAGVLWRVRFR